ncbi:hypothetical protein BH11PSE12_BH11PSE12_31850 [soil metagenome]
MCSTDGCFTKGFAQCLCSAKLCDAFQRIHLGRDHTGTVSGTGAGREQYPLDPTCAIELVAKAQ